MAIYKTIGIATSRHSAGACPYIIFEERNDDALYDFQKEAFPKFHVGSRGYCSYSFDNRQQAEQKFNELKEFFPFF